MELILENWWQFSIIAVVLTICLYFAGKSAESIFKLIKEILVTIAKEALFKTESIRAATINIIMAIVSGAIAFALVLPNILAQLGLKEENNGFISVLGVAQLLIVLYGSGYFVLRFQQQYPAFRDDEIKLNVGNEESKPNKAIGKKSDTTKTAQKGK